MNLHIGSRARAAVTLILAATIASVTASGPIVSAKDDTAGCVYYETPYKQVTIVTDASGETRCVSTAEAAAIAEAQGWPNFDSTALGDRLEMVRVAGEEAAAWPDFDPTDMTQEIAQYEAQQEAAGWPDYDSTAIDTSASTTAAANSPRMTQIAAETSSDNNVSDVAYDAPLPGRPGQMAF